MKKCSENQSDVVVLGGGAAGMMAAIWAKKQGVSVLLIESTDTLGRKILSTGNGRCNFSNKTVTGANYRTNTGNLAFFDQAFSVMPPETTLDYFQELGLLWVQRNGMLYPRSMQASTIAGLLTREIFLHDIPVLYQCKIKKIEKLSDGFRLTKPGEQGTLHCKRLILATGGPASEVLGSTDDGAYYSRLLGHQIEPYVPALTSLYAAAPFSLEDAAGVRCPVHATLFLSGKPVAEDTGELQITSYGLSGIVIFQLSRYGAYGCMTQKDVVCHLDFFPEYSKEDLEKMIRRRLDTCRQTRIGDAFLGMLQNRLLLHLLKCAGIDADLLTEHCPGEQLQRLLKLMKDYPVKIAKTNSMRAAQVSAGGVSLSEINPLTMESVLIPGLHFAGELMDVDGMCGGYNLHWAWTSGRIAGVSAGRGIHHDTN